MEGGTRTRNQFTKTISPAQPLVSIITVVYNSERLIENTILSIIDQTYENVEFIIIDGGSKDKTIDIIQKYGDQIAYWISEPDKGLYDAMNKGIEKATGTYLWFINSGDRLYNEHILSSVFGQSSDLQEIYYGETLVIDEDGNDIGLRRLSAPEKLTWKNLAKGMVVCHQSIIVKREIAPKFNINYKYSADFDWVIQSLKKAKLIFNTHLILSKFLDGGQTKKTIVPGLKERFRIMMKNYGIFITLMNHIFLGIKFLWFVVRFKRY